MTVVYAQQNDTLDAVCYRVYGRTQGLTEQVLKANPDLAEHGPILPHGTPITLPTITEPQHSAPRVQLWD
ncbi:tail protein X [Halomonas sp. AOP22-C1-8]|uniref:tail protein X n=1 Tax=Halomonas sp. AOP22-C1-8 TaxID=3457717 RepID=UPI004033CC60